MAGAGRHCWGSGLLFAVTAGILVSPYWNLPSVTTKDLDGLQLGDCPNLMVVAHPDDELLWGGKRLLEGGYLVVCLTRGTGSIRRAEFEKVVSAAGRKSLMLSYPDKIWKWRADLSLWREKIEADIATILQYKDWDTVASRNANGGYGHQHHKLAHEAVEKEYRDTGCRASLYWFGKYYANGRIPYCLKEMDKPDYNRKRELAKFYQSQRTTIRHMYHMLPYEHWEQAALRAKLRILPEGLLSYRNITNFNVSQHGLSYKINTNQSFHPIFQYPFLPSKIPQIFTIFC